MNSRAENIAVNYTDQYGEDYEDLVEAINDAIRAAVTGEREACAQLCMDTDSPPGWGMTFADAIRARSGT